MLRNGVSRRDHIGIPLHVRPGDKITLKNWARSFLSMNLIVNGEAYQHDGQGALTDLLRECKAEPGRTAVMINGAVVRKGQLDDARLSEGDQVELITIAAGG